MTAEPTDRGAPLLSCSRLQVGYGRAPILPPFDVKIGRGELWVVIGRNGAGKSTWFRTMLGLLSPVGGNVSRADGVRVSYVPQRSTLDPLFPLAARDVVRMGTVRGRGFLGVELREPPAVARALGDVDALDLADRPFRDLSEGQKARVLLARLIASEPDLALLDEPTAAMDLVAERKAFEFFERLTRERGTTIVVVSHYLGLAKQFATNAVFLDRDCGSAVVGTPAEVFGHADFHRSYGRDAEDAHVHG